MVDGLIELSLRGIDAEFAEQNFHAKRAGFVGNNRNDARSKVFRSAQSAKQACERHRRRNRLCARTLSEFGIDRRIGKCQWSANLERTTRNKSIKGLTTLREVRGLGRVGRWSVERGILGINCRFGNLISELQAIAEFEDLGVAQFLN